MNGFRVVERVGDSLYMINHAGRVAMWSRRRLRRETACAATGKPLHIDDLAYGPVGSMTYRYRRLSAAFVEGRRD